jgi:ATP-dependent 26S proteasome regulatory subunit
MGHLVSILNQARLSAFETGSKLSCHHISKAFHKLVIRCPKISLTDTSRSTQHECDFIFSIASGQVSSLDQFIGITQDQRDIVNAFELKENRMLIISGPIGSGKSFLANAIAYNPSCPYVTVTSADILRSKIGETEKRLFRVLTSNSTVVIEDIDKLFPCRTKDEGSSDMTHTGSVERCLPVLLSVLDTCGPNTMIIGTTRRLDQVTSRLRDSLRISHLQLDGNLTFDTKIKLIKCEDPLFDVNSVKPFDLILVSNRSQCMQFAKENKMKRLRQALKDNK